MITKFLTWLCGDTRGSHAAKFAIIIGLYVLAGSIEGMEQ